LPTTCVFFFPVKSHLNIFQPVLGSYYSFISPNLGYIPLVFFFQMSGFPTGKGPGRRDAQCDELVGRKLGGEFTIKMNW
jgi:hypothetical protein